MRRPSQDPVAQLHYSKMLIGLSVLVVGTIGLTAFVVLFLQGRVMWLAALVSLATYIIGLATLIRRVSMMDVSLLRAWANLARTTGRSGRAAELHARADRVEYSLAVRRQQGNDR